MKIEIIKIHDFETTSPTYYVVVDGSMILDGSSGRYEEALELYNKIVADPNYLNTRKTVMQSTTIP